MESTASLTTFIIIFAKIINGQQKGLVNNQNVETSIFLSQQQPTHVMATDIQRFMNQHGNAGALPNNIDQHQVQVQINTPPPLLNAQHIQQPPDIKQQSLQLQPFLQEQQPLQVQQSLKLLQPLQPQQSLTYQPSQQLYQPEQALQQIQQSMMQPSTPIPVSSFSENVDLTQASVLQQLSNYQPLNSNLKLQHETVNLGQSFNSQNLNVVPEQNIAKPVELIINPQQDIKSQDMSSLRYYISPQQSALTVNSPVAAQNPSIALIPSYSINPIEQSYLPPYSYVSPSTEIQAAIVDRSKPVNSVPAVSPILTIQSPPVQNSNVQTYYYSQPATESRPNVYISQNPQFRYPQQQTVQLSTVQTQPAAAVIPSQSSVLSSIPVSMVQAPPVVSQYGISAGYPVNTIMAPAYTTQKSKSLNLKSFLPIILNLLKEKISSQNGCPCQSKNQSNELEVSSGYSNMKNYGALNEGNLSVLKTVSEELGDIECLRERKNLKIEKEIEEVSDESSEDDDSDEDEEEYEEED